MNKIRIIPSVLFKDNNAIRGKNFQSWRTVGSLLQTIKLYSLREVDELIFLDTNATLNNKINYSLIDDFADECFMPITVGGGIKNLNHIENLLKVGADRICINTAMYKDKNFVKNAIKNFGVQCIIVSVDYKKINNKKIVFVKSGSQNTEIELNDYLKLIEESGAGEVLLTSIDHDGTMSGFDNHTLKEINKKFKFKLIASGGAGNKNHVLKTIRNTKVTAVSCSSIFHFTEITPKSLKKYLMENNVKVRV